MQAKDLEVLKGMPFLFWVKDQQGKYIWGNQKINEFAGEDIVGKTDSELTWADNAEALRADDEQVLKSGAPLYRREYVDSSGDGEATLSVCKFPGEFEGEICAFGISFVIE